ncbi:SET and MYND domain-containing protein 4-like [Vespa mandarinia]|uniref:SET and MYND domain-containing protein 4-like n=1 Tax=Vespa mandarinia TaxID=7446 RepID=UPI001618DF23|nr:SET and MYND domain-containing protein 4-like [Vespa mandarinia]
MEILHEILHRRIKEANKNLWLTNKFNTLKNDEERVIFTLEVMQQFNVVPKIKNVPKSHLDSEKFRKEGNKLFLTNPLDGHKCIQILQLYTKSIAYANPSSEELALAYANRSAILLKIHKFRKSIQDIDRALSLNYPDKLKVKLYIRKVECLVSMGDSSIEEDYKAALHWLEKMSLNDLNRKNLQKKLQYLYEQSKNMIKKNTKKQENQYLFEVKSQNVEIPCSSDAIAIKYNERYGRHVVATRDISPGEVIASEKPYSFMLTPDNIYTHCSNCLEISLASIPCDHCTCAMYCSEKCKLEDWKKYHDIECPVYSVLFEISNYIKFDLFSARLAIQAIKEFNSLEDLRSLIKEIDEWDDPRTKGFSSDNKFHSDKYRSIYSLTTNTEKRLPIDLFRKSVDACIILYLLATRTMMFGDKLEHELSALIKNKDVTLIGGLILRHQQIIPTNIHSLDEEYGLDVRERGIAAMAFYSLFNHSCDPNILRYSRSTNMIICAAYPIKKGDQILDNYGQHYAIMVKQRRQEKLLQQYYFKCDCIPCKKDWPLYCSLPSFEDLVTNLYDKSIIMAALKKFDTYVCLATVGEVHDNFSYIIQDLLKMIQILYDHAPMPCREMNKVVETVKRVYSLSGNRFDLPVIT